MKNIFQSARSTRSDSAICCPGLSCFSVRRDKVLPRDDHKEYHEEERYTTSGGSVKETRYTSTLCMQQEERYHTKHASMTEGRWCFAEGLEHERFATKTKGAKYTTLAYKVGVCQ